MKCIDEEKTAALEALLSKGGKACIAVHTRPDGDALGSGIALKLYLQERRGIQASLILPDPAPATMAFLCKGVDIIAASENPAAAKAAMDGCNLLFLLDANTFTRTEALADMFRTSKATKVMVDHHINPDVASFDLLFSDEDISSTCELLYWLLRKLEHGDISAIPARSLYSLMTGMTTDTNNFANSVCPTTLTMARELLEAGVDREDILLHLYQEGTENRLVSWADMLRNHLHILPSGISFMIMNKAMSDAYGIEEGDTEGLVNVPLRVSKVKLSIFVREEDGFFRVSIRCKRGWSANKMATQYFHGGGHELAAGGKIFIPGDIPGASAMEGYLKDIAARFLQNQGRNQL